MTRNLGHFHSQKFAAFIFAVFVLCVMAATIPVEVFSTLVMGVVGLYTAFVGTRAYSDAQGMKFGQRTDPAPVTQSTGNAKKSPVIAGKEKEREVD